MTDYAVRLKIQPHPTEPYHWINDTEENRLLVPVTNQPKQGFCLGFTIFLLCCGFGHVVHRMDGGSLAYLFPCFGILLWLVFFLGSWFYARYLRSKGPLLTIRNDETIVLDRLNTTIVPDETTEIVLEKAVDSTRPERDTSLHHLFLVHQEIPFHLLTSTAAAFFPGNKSPLETCCEPLGETLGQNWKTEFQLRSDVQKVRKTHRRLGRIIMSALGMGAVLFSVCLFLMPMIPAIRLGLESTSWPHVDGEIIRSEYHSKSSPVGGGGKHRTRSTTTFWNDIDYRFRVDGMNFAGNQVAFTGFKRGSSNRDYHHGVALRYPVGKKVSVYYRPGDPNVSVLEPGRQASYWWLAIGGALCLFGVALLGIVAYSFVRKQEYDRVGDEID